MIETELRLSQTHALSVSEGNLQPVERFLLALKAPETKRQYPKLLESFFDFLRLNGSFEEKVISLCSLIRSHKDTEWLTDQLLKFLRYQKERVARKQIEEARVSNYFKAIKLFCEMNNILSINWKLIFGSLLAGTIIGDRSSYKRNSNGFCESEEDIQKLWPLIFNIPYLVHNKY